MTIEFEAFPKLPRYSKEVIITEKIDGTNAQIIITEDGEIAAGSRSRLIYPGKDTDNFGFAAWVQDNKEELLKLGPGRHFGEWYGKGIQRGYGLDERRFALFNAGRWTVETVPACVGVVPIVVTGHNTDGLIDFAMRYLSEEGSMAAPGFMDPEGIVIFHTGSRVAYKKTFDNDEGKWAA